MQKKKNLLEEPFNNYVDKKRGRGSVKSPMLVHPGGGGLECPLGPKFEKKSSYFIKYFIPLSSVMGDKIKI